MTKHIYTYKVYNMSGEHFKSELGIEPRASLAVLVCCNGLDS